MEGSDNMALSDAQKRANAKHDNENFETITFKARKGSKARISEAAEATEKSVNGFIRSAVSNAVEFAINKPMEEKKGCCKTAKQNRGSEGYCAEESIGYKR